MERGTAHLQGKEQPLILFRLRPGMERGTAHLQGKEQPLILFRLRPGMQQPSCGIGTASNSIQLSQVCIAAQLRGRNSL